MTKVLRHKSLKCIQWTVFTTNNSLVSETFSFQDRKCHLEFTVNMTYNDAYVRYINNAYLYFKSNGQLQSPVKVTVRVVTGVEEFSTETKSITYSNQIIWNTNTNLAQMLTFEVIFHVDASKDDKSVQISSYKDACYLVDSLSHDFGKLLDEGPNHDVEVTCGDQTVKAHKNILCCRSRVFASMLQSDMLEGKTGRINIQDIDATIFQQFLRCLYTGILPELTVDSAFQFYETSDKYGVDAVKKQCADYLTDNLSPENACEVLVLSDRHSDTDFKQNVIQYVIKEKIPYVGQKWADFCEENSVLAVEVYKLFCEQFRSK